MTAEHLDGRNGIADEGAQRQHDGDPQEDHVQLKRHGGEFGMEEGERQRGDEEAGGNLAHSGMLPFLYNRKENESLMSLIPMILGK